VLLEATGVAPYMQAIASGDDVTAGKPDPQVFLIAFERLGVSPRNGVVIEDAPAGVQAGLRAGAATLGVTTTQSVEALESAGANRIVASLAGITVDELEALVKMHQGKD
jgi:beta-phosphoglucomutase-like phosphatase (HAD superfamily)